MTLGEPQIRELNQILDARGARSTLDSSRQASAILQTDETDLRRITQFVDGVPLVSQELFPAPSGDAAVGGLWLRRPLPNGLLPDGLYGLFARPTGGGGVVPVLINGNGTEYSDGLDADLTFSTVRIARRSTAITLESMFFNYDTVDGSSTFNLRVGVDALLSPAERATNEQVATAAAQRLGLGVQQVDVRLALRGATGGSVIVAAPAALQPRFDPGGRPVRDELLGLFEAFGTIQTSNAGE